MTRKHALTSISLGKLDSAYTCFALEIKASREARAELLCLSSLAQRIAVAMRPPFAFFLRSLVLPIRHSLRFTVGLGLTCIDECRPPLSERQQRL